MEPGVITVHYNTLEDGDQKVLFKPIDSLLSIKEGCEYVVASIVCDDSDRGGICGVFRIDERKNFPTKYCVNYIHRHLIEKVVQGAGEDAQLACFYLKILSRIGDTIHVVDYFGEEKFFTIRPEGLYKPSIH
ncbi:hypothetical protein CPT_Moabite_173 [Serratia phage Moabite]|uniref:Uncharacterized protein n=3 Tax=Moabitevirus TaxID=2843422 RepID=A0A7T3NBH2_9CAUD|nr:hypothetical protein HWB23_gp092 [Serratia phage vB_SmaM_ 2050HW]YP_009849267.1 hypothetical protein HWC48_gp243 [Serratia phage Moabite]QPX76651.1 hypothetical protein [Serratia phage vB_SmaM_Yaphecito]UCR74702.1 hypothetical protein [Serratia phage BUCT660]UGO54058.1 hypothetical protein HAYMO_76 [Serratia phage vB_SmaM_Haymo]UQT03567.1 hypothetical protein KODAMA_01000 [Serratia phage vB_SmaM-Kodama]ATA65427.1 hypothetical protein 2050HW_00092 [Serratia phage vB_SmaM_ 2050HW]